MTGSHLTCCVKGCKNVASFTFPKNEEVKSLWIKACLRSEGRAPKYHSRMCVSHFSPTDIISFARKRILKKGAVPFTGKTFLYI